MSKIPRQNLSGNRGGGCVESHHLHVTEAGNHILHLRGPEGVVSQILGVAPEYRPLEPHRPWSHRLWSPGDSIRDDVSSVIELLESVLTVRCAAGVDFAIALDRTKLPVEGMDGRLWPNTELGEMVQRGKYLYAKDPAKIAELRAVGQLLVTEICEVIDAHPLLRKVDAVVGVPGHDSRWVSFGSRLANAVALARNVRFVRCASRVPYRTPAKNLAPADRAASVANQFVCTDDLSAARVLIVDDLYSTGATVGETARAARDAGAVQVSSICAVRTMRV